jgi:hypothetical protein
MPQQCLVALLAVLVAAAPGFAASIDSKTPCSSTDRERQTRNLVEPLGQSATHGRQSPCNAVGETQSLGFNPE